jgi:hypothetical protein
MDRTRRGIDEAVRSSARRGAFTVLVATVVVLTAATIVGCGTQHSSGRPSPTQTSSTTYAEGGDSVPPLSTPAPAPRPSTPGGLVGPVTITRTPRPSTPGGLVGPVTVTPTPPPSTPGGLGGPVIPTPTPTSPTPPPSTPGGLGGPVIPTPTPPPSTPPQAPSPSPAPSS